MIKLDHHCFYRKYDFQQKYLHAAEACLHPGSFHVYKNKRDKISCYTQCRLCFTYVTVSASLILNEHAITAPQHTQQMCTCAQYIVVPLGLNSKSILFSSSCFAISTTSKAIRKSGEPITNENSFRKGEPIKNENAFRKGWSKTISAGDKSQSGSVVTQ